MEGENKGYIFYKSIYDNNKEFREYVDRLMRAGKNDHGKDLNDILKRKTVQDIADYYVRKNGGLEPSPVSTVSTVCDLGCDDKGC